MGWMLSEVGKKDELTLKAFLLRAAQQDDAQTALRYAIERVPIEVRRAYLKGTICK
jgi:3-methyladenine DNA glycosylase AlkD